MWSNERTFVENFRKPKASEKKKLLSGHAKLILSSILYLDHETEYEIFDHRFMFEKSDAHIVYLSLTRFLKWIFILADKVNHDYGRSTAYKSEDLKI